MLKCCKRFRFRCIKGAMSCFSSGFGSEVMSNQSSSSGSRFAFALPLNRLFENCSTPRVWRKKCGRTSRRNVSKTRRGGGHVASQTWMAKRTTVRKNMLKSTLVLKKKAKEARKAEPHKCLCLQHDGKTSLEFVDNSRK